MGSISLRDYQMDAVNHMRNGCILCGGVGSGKSRTSLAYYYKENGGKLNTEKYEWMVNPQDLYIITTARKRDEFEWDDELIPFMLNQNPELNGYKNKVVIDSWNNIGKYVKVTNAFFIFDEQRVVGSGAWVKAFLKITKANNWILLSATPGDTWEDYIPVFLANGFYKNRTEFKEQHMVISWVGGKYPKVERYLGLGRLLRLRQRILVNMDFNRQTVAHHEDIYTDYDFVGYKWIAKNRKNPYKPGYIPCDPCYKDSLVVGRDIDPEDVNVMEGWDYTPAIGDSVRLEYLPIESASELCYTWRKLVNSDESRQTELLMLHEKHPKMIVFYNHDYELEILKSLWYGDGAEVAEWNGHKHQPVPKGDNWVYLVQYTAGAEGWNCITTDTIVFYSQTYSYKVLTQAAGRIDRMNTPYIDLYYYHMKSRAPIDLAIGRAIAQKKDFNAVRFVGKPKTRG